MRSMALATAACLQLLGGAVVAQESPLVFKDQERVVFFGDSITHGGTYVYHLQTFYATRYPERSIVFENAGISGAEVVGSLPRIDLDVLARRPTRVLACFGMNDVNRQFYASVTPDADTAAKRAWAIGFFIERNGDMLKRFEEAKVPVVLVSPPPFNQYRTAPGGEDRPACNDGLANLTAALKTFAAGRSVPFIDIHTPMTGILKANPGYAYGDRIHPGGPGYLMIAYHIAKGQGVRESVATVGIDYAAGTVSAQDNCAVTEVAVGKGTLAFTYAARSLPFPQSQDYIEASALCPIASINRELIQVRGLPEGRYALRVGESSLGFFSATDLGNGLDIALLDTPQQRQAQAIWREVSQKAQRFEEPLRNRAMIVYSMRQRKLDPEDKAAFAKELDAMTAGGGYGAAVAATVRPIQDNLAAIMSGREESQKAILALQKVAPMKVSLTRVDGSQAFTVVKALYGAEGHWLDVTILVKAQVADGVLSFKVENRVLSDPAPGQAKTLRVTVSTEGKEYLLEAREEARLIIDRDVLADLKAKERK